MPYPKGAPKPAQSGRQKGTPNKATVEIKAFAQSILEDPEYQRKLKARILLGKAPRMEELLYYYAYGKPQDNMKLAGHVTLAELLGEVEQENG